MSSQDTVSVERPSWLPTVYGIRRKGGATAGRVDTYYRNPAGKVFRSQVSVERFLNGEKEIVQTRQKKTKGTPPKPKLPTPRPESKLTYDVRQQSKSLQEQGLPLRARAPGSPGATKPIQETPSRAKMGPEAKTSPSVAKPGQGPVQDPSFQITLRAKMGPGATSASPPKPPERDMRAKASPGKSAPQPNLKKRALSTSSPMPENKQQKIQLRSTVGNKNSDRPVPANSSSPESVAVIAKRTSSIEKAKSLKEQQESQLTALRNMPNIRQKRAEDVPSPNAPVKPTTEIEAKAKALKEMKEEETRRKLEQLESVLDFSLEMELGFLVVDKVEPQDDLPETKTRPNIRQVAPKVRKVPETSVLVVHVSAEVLERERHYSKTVVEKKSIRPPIEDVMVVEELQYV